MNTAPASIAKWPEGGFSIIPLHIVAIGHIAMGVGRGVAPGALDSGCCVVASTMMSLFYLGTPSGMHRPHCVYWREARVRRISTCHRENRRKEEYPNCQDLSERFHRSLSLGGRKKNEITED
jgi:hypothetical protein